MRTIRQGSVMSHLKAFNGYLRVMRLGLVLVLLSFSAQASDEVSVSINTEDGLISTEDLRGDVIYLDFWASWCVPCRRSFPWMNTMLEKYADKGLTIIAVTVDQNRADVAAFLAETPANFTIGFDPEASLAEEFNLQAMPSAFIIGRNGQLLGAHYGFREANTDDYEASIVKALEG